MIHSNIQKVNFFLTKSQWSTDWLHLLTITSPYIEIASYAAIDSLDDSWLRPLGYARAMPPAQLFPRYQSFIRKSGKNLSRGEGLLIYTLTKKWVSKKDIRRSRYVILNMIFTYFAISLTNKRTFSKCSLPQLSSK